MELLTVKQAAIILKVHQLTIRRYIREGKLEALKIAGNIRIKKEFLNKMIGSFIPQARPIVKGKILVRMRTFSTQDPFFRLKGRVISYPKNSLK